MSHMYNNSCLYPLERYMVTELMGADLNSILRFQKLSDEHVQFLVYQILRGLKVRNQVDMAYEGWIAPSTADKSLSIG